ncbi:hypothetical protein K431DRAFT_240860, partial [Polychaeton citri CBS 116435]
MESPTAAILILNLPDKSFAGIDLLSFTTTTRFQGIKNVPPGFHFLFTGSSTSFSIRHGVWFHIAETSPPPLIVTKWDPQTETLKVETSEAELLKQRANLGSLWRERLTPYRQCSTPSRGDGEALDTSIRAEGSDWKNLTSCISPPLLSRVLRANDSSQWTLSSASSAQRDLDDLDLPSLSNDAEGSSAPSEKDLDFLPIDLKQTWRKGAVGRERTEAAKDRSWALTNLVSHYCTRPGLSELEQARTQPGELDMIGELQFAFLALLTVNNFSCLEQWKRILSLLLTSRSAIPTYPTLFTAFLQTLRLQLSHLKDTEGGTLIDLADDSGNLLKKLLSRFRKGLEESSGSGSSTAVQAVMDELDELEELLEKEFGWQIAGDFARSGVLELEDGEQVRVETSAFDMEDETGEYAPLVVDLTPEQMRMLGL